MKREKKGRRKPEEESERGTGEKERKRERGGKCDI